MSDRPTDRQDRLTVAGAADRLGISEDAVRSRLKRGTMRSVRDGGVVYVLLDADRPTTDQATGQTTRGATDPPGSPDPRDELISVLREQLAAEREANRENRRLLAAVLERMPAIETTATDGPEPETPTGGSEASEDATHGAAMPETGTETRPGLGERLRRWWRR